MGFGKEQNSFKNWADKTPVRLIAFPVENMPVSIQIISYAIPFKYFITIVCGVILKGSGFAEHWIDALVLLGIGMLILFLSALRFRKKLE